jgi:hypothetical protein
MTKRREMENMFIDEEDKKIYRYLRGVEGTSEVLMGNFRYGLWNWIKYTILLWL